MPRREPPSQEREPGREWENQRGEQEATAGVDFIEAPSGEGASIILEAEAETQGGVL